MTGFPAQYTRFQIWFANGRYFLYNVAILFTVFILGLSLCYASNFISVFQVILLLQVVKQEVHLNMKAKRRTLPLCVHDKERVIRTRGDVYKSTSACTVKKCSYCLNRRHKYPRLAR